MGSGGSGTGGGSMGSDRYGPGSNLAFNSPQSTGGSGGPVTRQGANTPEMRTYKDASGNTVRVYQQANSGRMTAVGYKEVYSPSGRLISTTKPQASANTSYTPYNPTRPSGGEPH